MRRTYLSQSVACIQQYNFYLRYLSSSAFCRTPFLRNPTSPPNCLPLCVCRQSYGIQYRRDSEVEIITYIDHVETSGPAAKAGMREGES